MSGRELSVEAQEFEAQQAEAFFGGGRDNSGMLVTTRTGLRGRTYSKEGLYNGKVKVYTEGGKLLCTPESLTVNGFID